VHVLTDSPCEKKKRKILGMTDFELGHMVGELLAEASVAMTARL
jgi:hypothetical protein